MRRIIYTSLVIAMLAGLAGCAGGGAERVYKPTVKPVQPQKAGDKNGIKWNDWDAAAFARAEAEGKLVFLDISASWCHWCMVMEEDVYSDPRVVEMLNTGYVPVYVDTDKRPDINDKYNQGGWPSIAILTPKGRVLAGRTTMTADDLLVFLSTAKAAYDEDRDAVIGRIVAKEIAIEEDKERREKEKRSEALGAQMPIKVLGAVNLFVDPQYGGYGGPDKFPLPEVMSFALDIYPKVKDNKEYTPKAAITLTLDNMAKGLLDPVEGGFFRYSTTVDWKSPHYEKLLSANGDLLSVYMHAYRTLGASSYRGVGEAVAGYMEGALLNPATGLFWNSQAADERYYKLDYASRVARGAPPVDQSVFADSNARAALGFLEAYRATGDQRYLAVARRTVDGLMAWFSVDGSVKHTISSTGMLLLSDQVYTALAAEKTYQATGDMRYLGYAMSIASGLTKRFWDMEKSGFFDSWYEEGAMGLLDKKNKPQTENANAAMLMTDLYHITGDKVYRETAKHTLMPYSTEYAKYTFWAAPFAHAATRCIETSYEFLVLGPPDDPRTKALVKKAYMFDDPDRVVVALDPSADKARIDDLGYEYEGEPILYVCSEKACFPPVGPDGTLDKTRESIDKARKQEAK